MAQHLLFKTYYISIFYDYNHEWLYVDWTGDQTLETVQTGCLQMLECMRDERCHKVLNDNTRVTSMWADAAEWGGHVWFPAMADAGLQCFAWIYSPNVYSRLSTDLTLQHTTRPLILTFDSLETASAWLKQM